MAPSREMDKGEKRERGGTDRAFPDMPDPRSFSSEYDRWHRKWQLKFNTTHADVWFLRFAHAHGHTVICSPTFDS
jgi:hypothetical protein